MDLHDSNYRDPFNWTIDEVVEQFCHNTRPLWSVERPSKAFPSADRLEKAFRDNDLFGEYLLELTEGELKNEFGISSLVQRREVLKAIDFLRRNSREIQQRDHQQDSGHLARALVVQTPDYTPSNLSGLGYSPSLQGGRHPSQALELAPQRRNNSPADRSISRFVQHLPNPSAAQLPPLVTRLVQSASDREHGHLFNHKPRTFDNLRQHAGIGVVSSSRNSPSAPDGIIFPSIEDDNPLLDALEGRLVATTAHSAGEEDTLVRVKPKITKKIAPTFVKGISPSRAQDFQNQQAVPGRLIDEGNLTEAYLRPTPLPNEKSFYPIGTDDDFQMNMTSFGLPIGLRKVVGKAMHIFLNQPILTLPTNHRTKARIPYKETLSADGRYFTVFRPGSDPAVRSLEDWPTLKALEGGHRRRKLKPISTKISEQRADTQNPFLLPEITASDDVDGYELLLLKYPPNNDDLNDILPLFGDSEDEIDDDMWDEIERENEESGQLKASRNLSRKEVASIIDDTIQEQEVQWRENVLAKVQLKGYRIWKEAARHNDNEIRIQQTAHWINNLTSRIDKAREAILDDIWHKGADVKTQCQSLEQSVFQREEQRYFVTILENPDPPPRPLHVHFIRPKPRVPPADLGSDEEVLDSESDLNMGDFIVDDSSDVESIPHGNDCEVRVVEDFGDVPADQQLLFEQQTPSTPLPVQKGPPSIAAQELAVEYMTQDADSDEDEIISSSRKRALNAANETKYFSSVQSPKKPKQYRQSGSASEQDSDLDRQRLLKTKYRHQGSSASKPIDLTLAHSPTRESNEEDRSTSNFEVSTPPLNPLRGDATSADLKLKLLPQHSTPVPQGADRFPALNDVDGIKQLPWKIIEEQGDMRRALAKAVYSLEFSEVKMLRDRFLQWGDDDVKKHALRRSLRRFGKSNITSSQHRDSYLRPKEALPLLFLTYLHLKDMIDPTAASEGDLEYVLGELERTHASFFQTLAQSFNALSALHTPKRGRKRKFVWEGSSRDPEDELDVEMLEDDSADLDKEAENPPPSSHKKRKRAVAESQEAKFLQRHDQARVEDQERRKAQIKERLLAMGKMDTINASHVINALVPTIELDPHIGRRVKPHQVEGISFMWREIIADPKQQGCLLAHTMGLGKTMQVLSLLLTISQCGSSSELDIKAQIPANLRHVKALVLCPPTLVNNWFDEFHMWVPEGSVLGGVSMVSSSYSSTRLRSMREWSKNGGVLLMGYEMFRDFVKGPSEKKAWNSKYTEAERDEITDLLLNGPNIVVADEAHKLKNSKSQISMIAQRFKTRSRIALTGSPLNNHLEEYHAMVEWIAPGYLGDLVQFKSKYSEPIMEGLYAESSQYERRVSMRKLHVLKRDLDPKINRADISAIEKDMPTKTEFFIEVPLTPAQKVAYNILVDHIQQYVSKGNGNARLWGWVFILGLLCHHPYPFVEKMQDRKRAQLNARAVPTLAPVFPASDSEDPAADADGDPYDALSPATTSPDDVPVADLGLSLEVIEKTIDALQDNVKEKLLRRPGLSNRTELVNQIVQESISLGDKVLIFTHSIPTLNYLEKMMGKIYAVCRIDGSTSVNSRQGITKIFNEQSGGPQVFLISMRAGGLGLNLQGANRVIIFDFSWNPTWEEQAIGRAYRLGQKKPVYVYRFRTGGTFENVMYNKSIFKNQLFERVVNKKNVKGVASKSISDYIFPVKEPEQADLSDLIGKDRHVLDKIIPRVEFIRQIQLTETFQREEDEGLDEKEQALAEQEYRDQVLEREDPAAYRVEMQKRHALPMARGGQNEKAAYQYTNFSANQQQSVSISRPAVNGTAHIASQLSNHRLGIDSLPGVAALNASMASANADYETPPPRHASLIGERRSLSPSLSLLPAFGDLRSSSVAPARQSSEGS